jgi:predicted nuclease with TOPRIM domain
MFFRSRKENLQLSSEYNKLQESYKQLEALKQKLETKEAVWRSNMTDSQKETDLEKNLHFHLSFYSLNSFT